MRYFYSACSKLQKCLTDNTETVPWKCMFGFLQKYKEFERAVRVEEMDGLRLVKRLAKDMEEMFHKKAQAMKVGRPLIKQDQHKYDDDYV